MEKKNKKANVVEMAKKKRHISLLEKMQKGKALTSAEIRELAEFEKGEKKPNIVNTKKEVAVSFDVSVRTITNWMQDGMPVRKNGRYDLLEVKNWKIMRDENNRIKLKKKRRQNKEVDQSTESTPDDGKEKKFKETYDEADTRWKIAQANKVELENKIKEGAYIPRDDAVKVIKESIMLIKRQFLSLPKQVAPQLAGLEVVDIEQILTGRIKEIISGFARGKFK